MSQKNYNIDIVEMQDKNLVIDYVKTTGNTKIIRVYKPIELSNISCKLCGSLHISVHAYHVRKIKFLDISSFKSIIEYNQRRFKCKDCNKTFNEDTSLVEKGCNISNQIKIKLLDDLRNKVSFTEVTEKLSLSVTTAINEFLKHAIDYRCKLSEVICFDEFRASTIAGEYALIIGNPINGKILDALPSRRQDYIYYYFQTISQEEIAKVKYIITDLFEPYRTICYNIFWRSIHIADRFHWIRLATEAFNKIRIRIMNSYYKLGEEAHKGSYNKYTKYANVLKNIINYYLLIDTLKKNGFLIKPKLQVTSKKK